MKNAIRLALIIFPFVLCLSVHAGPLPSSVPGNFSQIENRFGKSTFDWRMSYKETDAAESVQQIQAKQKAITEQLPSQLRSLGISDEAGIKAQVESMVHHIAEAGEGATYVSSTDWTFVRNGPNTLVSGVRQLEKTNSLRDTSQSFRHYYSGNTGLIFNDSAVINGQQANVIDPVVWINTGDSIRFPSPATEGLGVEPEHFVLLMATNPLSMYSNEWHLSSETAKYWKLEAACKQVGWPPINIDMTLDKSHSDLPSEIEVSTNRGQDIVKAHVTDYTTYQGDPLISRVILTEHEAGVYKIQNWQLLGVQASKPISLAYSGSNPVHDFRLVGANIPQLAESELPKSEQSSVVLYRWPGQLPNIEQLKGLRDLRHPGEIAPDPDKSGSAMPFAGGLMCLVGGVWMFKRRGA